MEKLNLKEIQEYLLEEIPDVFASSDVSDEDNDDDVVGEVCRPTTNYFDLVFNELVNNVNANETEENALTLIL